MQTYDPSAVMPVRGLGLINTVKSVWVNEGLIGFYKGMVPNLLRVVPSTCVTFLVYENVRWSLPRMFGGTDPTTETDVSSNSRQKEGTL